MLLMLVMLTSVFLVFDGALILGLVFRDLLNNVSIAGAL